MSKVITFSRVFPTYHPSKGAPTYFVEAIRLGLIQENDIDFIQSLPDLTREIYNPALLSHVNSKRHTIRGTSPEKWKGPRFKVGDKFSPRVWSGKPYNSKQVIIAPDIEIKKVFDFEIFGTDYLLEGKKLSLKDLTQVAMNDGLSADDFELWFNDHPFKGQIICWSDEVDYSLYPSAKDESFNVLDELEGEDYGYQRSISCE